MRRNTDSKEAGFFQKLLKHLSIFNKIKTNQKKPGVSIFEDPHRYDSDNDECTQDPNAGNPQFLSKLPSK